MNQKLVSDLYRGEIARQDIPKRSGLSVDFDGFEISGDQRAEHPDAILKSDQEFGMVRNLEAKSQFRTKHRGKVFDGLRPPVRVLLDRV